MHTITNILKAKWWVLAAIIAFNISACSDVEEKDIENKKVETPSTPPEKEEVKKNKGTGEDEYTEAKVDLGLSKEDINYLMLLETFPLGTTPHSMHEKMPIVKGVRPEGGSDENAEHGLTEAKVKVTILDKPADLELNFKNDSLYSFYYTITESDFNKAEKLYKGIQQFYNKKIGQGVQLTAEEETRDIKTSVWTDTYPYGIMTYNINTGVISWGFQNTKP